MRNLDDILKKAREVSRGMGGAPSTPPPAAEALAPRPTFRAPTGDPVESSREPETEFPAPIAPVPGPAPAVTPEAVSPPLASSPAPSPEPAPDSLSPPVPPPDPDPTSSGTAAPPEPDPLSADGGPEAPTPRPPDGITHETNRLANLGGKVMTAPTNSPSTASLGSDNGPGRLPPEPQTTAPPAAPTAVQQSLGKGLDIGTANLVSAVQNEGGIQLALQRNAFIDVQSDVYTKNMLTKLGVPYAQQNDRLYVLGDASFELANIFGRETRRPMQRGLISPNEIDALPVIRLLIERVLGMPTIADEKLYFSVPAEPIDSDLNVVYHEGIFSGMLRKVGYDARPIVEGHAVALAELADEDFTGIGISCGGGMFNVCVSYKTIPALTFSTTRAGDWVDQNVAAVCGIPTSKATLVKEEGVDLMNPVGREQEAVSIYYRNLINYTLVNIKHRFESSEGMPVFREPISIVCSGGTSLVGSFIECFREEFQKVSFPIPVRDIRLAENPLMVVAKGALIAAALGD
jgi:hypothetical protein